MRLLQLNLAAFGPFTDRRLDFSDEPGRVHFVYGPNEAGKSSALRAIKQALYGIPVRTTDDFTHNMKLLRIGLTIRSVGGDELTCLRRKGNSKTLLSADGQTQLDDGALLPFLGGITLPEFEQMFGINHPALVEGGQEIVRLHGSVDKSLFAAAGSVADLQRIQSQLEADAASLFTPRAGKISAAISELAKTKEKLQHDKVPSKEWAELNDQFDAATRTQSSTRDEVGRLQREYARLGRFKDAFPLMARRRELLLQLIELGEIRLLRDDFTQQRTQAVFDLKSAAQSEERLRVRLEELERNIGAVVVPQEVLDQREALENLAEQLGVYRKAQQDLPSLTAQRDQLLQDAHGALRELRPDLTWDKVSDLKLTRAEEVEIQNLGNRHAGLLQVLEQARQAVQTNTLALATAQAKLETLPSFRDAAELRNALQRAVELGPIESKAAELRLRLQQGQEYADAAVRRLTFWSGTVAELERLIVPTPESVDVCEEEIKETTQILKQTQAEVRQVESRAAECRRDLDKLTRAAGELPTEEDLLSSRRVRNAGWQLVRRAWLEGTQEPDRIDAYTKEVGCEGELAPVYERSVQRTDEVADRLRREADRVANRAAIQADLVVQETRLRELATSVKGAEAACLSAADKWRRVWESVAIIPGTPKEMRAWLKQYQDILQQCREITTDRLAVIDLQGRIDEFRGEISKSLVALGNEPVTDTESLVAVRQRGLGIVQAIDDVERQRSELTAELRRLEIHTRQDAQRTQLAEQDLRAWTESWSAAMTPLGLPVSALPPQASETLSRIRELFERVSKSEGFARRIQDIGRDAEQFKTHVDLLLRNVGEVAPSGSIEDAANILIAAGRRTGERQALLVKYRTEREKLLPQHAAALLTIDQCQAKLAALCVEAGSNNVEQLPALEQRSLRAASLRKELTALEQSLASLTGGLNLEEFAAAIADKDVDSLPTELESCATRLRELNQGLESISSERGALEQRLKLMHDGAEAADVAQKMQDLVARISNDCSEFARLRIAAVVLKRTIERFRDKNQGPILQRAGRHFAVLTAGRFSGLRIEYNEKDEAVLVGVRAQGQSLLHVEEMSDGTADQLYLSLKIASLETYLQSREPIPFIVDDILIQFDDDRAAATLATLAELSKSTQVILFTHHEHLLTLGQKCLGEERMCVQRL